MSETRNVPSYMTTGNVLRWAWRRMRLPLHSVHARRRLTRFHGQPRTLEEVVDAALSFGTKGLLRIKALQTRSEILTLAHRVEAMKPRVVLEIGTAYAGTLFIWSHIASRKIIACDLKHPSYRASLYRRLPPPGSLCRVIPIAGDSRSPTVLTKVRQALGPDRVDVLFIDGDHTLEGVTADYETFREFVRPGGVIVFHDIVDRGSEDRNVQVAKLWTRLVDEYAEFEEIVEDASSSDGVGILHTPEL